MFENIALAFQGIWSHKLRSFLTMLGIIIGIASIITIISTIKGTNEQIKEKLVGSGTNAVKVQLYQGDSSYDTEWGSNPAGVSVISEETRQALLKFDGVSDVSMFLQRTYVDGVYYKNTAFSGTLLGIDDSYFNVYNYRISYGRNFSDKELAGRKKAAIIDATAVSTLFGGENPLGQTIEINKEPFVVVGVASVSGNYKPNISNMSEYYLYADTSTGKIFVPSAAWPIIYRFDEPQIVAVKAESTDSMTKVGKDVADYLTASQIKNPDTSQFSYKGEDITEQAQQLQQLSSSTNKQLIWIAGISLLVGGIGVMNIMLVSVTERTKEIGLKKAIGAKKKRICWQFLTEAAALTCLGGLLGVIVGVTMAKLISSILGTATAISIPAILVSVLFSIVIGVVFGLLPAVKASNLNPIDALRRE